MVGVQDLFKQLVDWRHLPAYSVERRLDFLFGLTLNEILGSQFNSRFQHPVIPEFPLKSPGSNHSTKVDFLAMSYKGKKRTIYLVELKTDRESCDEDQLENYVSRKREFEKCPTKIVCDVIEIAKASKSKRKYVHLLFKLQQLDMIPQTDILQSLQLESSGVGIKSKLDKLSEMVTCPEFVNGFNETRFKVVLISPKKPEFPNSATDVHWICLAQCQAILKRHFAEDAKESFLELFNELTSVQSGHKNLPD